MYIDEFIVPSDQARHRRPLRGERDARHRYHLHLSHAALDSLLDSTRLPKR